MSVWSKSRLSLNICLPFLGFIFVCEQPGITETWDYDNYDECEPLISRCAILLVMVSLCFFLSLSLSFSLYLLWTNLVSFLTHQFKCSYCRGKSGRFFVVDVAVNVAVLSLPGGYQWREFSKVWIRDKKPSLLCLMMWQWEQQQQTCCLLEQCWTLHWTSARSFPGTKAISGNLPLEIEWKQPQQQACQTLCPSLFLCFFNCATF